MLRKLIYSTVVFVFATALHVFGATAGNVLVANGSGNNAVATNTLTVVGTNVSVIGTGKMNSVVATNSVTAAAVTASGSVTTAALNVSGLTTKSGGQTVWTLATPTGSGTTNLTVNFTNNTIYVETLGFSTTWITFTNIPSSSIIEETCILRLIGNGSRSIQILNNDLQFSTAISTNSLLNGETEFILRWTGTQKTLYQSPDPYLTGLTGNVQTQLTAKQGALLDGVNQTDTLAGAVQRGDLIVGNSTPKWGRLPVGTFGSILRTDATDVLWDEPQNFTRFFDDFISSFTTTPVGDTGWQTSIVGGTTAADEGEQGRPGIFTLGTSTSSTAAPSIFKSLQSHLFGGGRIILQAAIKIPTLSDGTERFKVRFGFTESATSALVDGAMFEYRDNLNSGNWMATTANNGSSTTASGGSSVAVVANTWTTLKIDVNAAGTSVSFYVNGTLVGTSASNIPTGVGRGTGVRLSIEKSLGTTARTVSVDYVSMLQKFTTSR